jgi:hypothetical protein
MFPGEEGSLAYIIDITFEAPVEMHIEKRNARSGKTEIIFAKTKSTELFCVTMRSNHVTPGWRFNSDTVRWYIEDINFTKRVIRSQIATGRVMNFRLLRRLG